MPTATDLRTVAVHRLCSLCERDIEADYLCTGCTAATARRLERMPRLYEALAAFLQPGGRRPELGRTRPAEAPLPVAEHVLTLRGPGGIVAALEDWRAVMQADRGWGPPAIAGTTEARVAAATRGLALNLDWVVSEWPRAGEFAAVVRDLERDVLSVIDPPERTIRLGHCPADVGDGQVCGAALRVPTGTAEVRCRWCGTHYPQQTWLNLRAWMDEDQAAARPRELSDEPAAITPPCDSVRT